MQRDEITHEDIDLLRELRTSGDLPDHFWQVPYLRFLIMLIAAVALGVAAHAYDQDWLTKPLLLIAPMWLGHYLGRSSATHRYKALLLKLLDRDPALRQRM